MSAEIARDYIGSAFVHFMQVDKSESERATKSSGDRHRDMPRSR